MELHRFFRYAIEKMCKEKKSLNHFNIFSFNTVVICFHFSIFEPLETTLTGLEDLGVSCDLLSF